MSVKSTETVEVNGTIVDLRILPHAPQFASEYAMLTRAARKCWGAFGDHSRLIIEVCRDHTNPQIRGYVIEHERTEMMMRNDPEFLKRSCKEAPIHTRNAHNLANSIIYRLAAARGELDMLHANWNDTEQIEERLSSRLYRERLYGHYQTKSS